MIYAALLVSGPGSGNADEKYIIKGNIWGLTPEGLKCAYRVVESNWYFHPTLGFRLAITVGDNFFD